MPQRNPVLGGLLAGIAGPLQDYLAQRQRDVTAKKADERLRRRQADESTRTEERTLRKDFLDRVTRGEMEPEQAQRAMTMMGHPTTQGAFDSVQPSVENEVGKVVKGIIGTKEYGDLPSEAEVNAGLPKRIAPLRTPEVPLQFRDMSSDAPPFETDDPHANRISGALQATRRRLAGNTPVTELETTNADTGAPQKQARRFNPIENRFTDLGTTTTGPTAAQAGTLASGKTAAELAADLANKVPERQGEAKGRQADVEQPGVMKRLQEELGVRDAHTRGNARYAHGLTAANDQLTTTTLHDAEGNEVPGVLNKRTLQVSPAQMPDDFKGGKATRLTTTQAAQVADINAAETEAVRVLEKLHATGLAKSNDPGGARWRRFLQNDMKIALPDAEEMMIGQNVANVRVSILKSLMGGRPSKYLLEEFSPHIPGQGQTGKAMAETLEQVLRQLGAKRQEMQGAIRGAPASVFTPKSGKTYEQYRREREGVPVPPGTKPMFVVDPKTGELVPNK